MVYAKDCRHPVRIGYTSKPCGKLSQEFHFVVHGLCGVLLKSLHNHLALAMNCCIGIHTPAMAKIVVKIDEVAIESEWPDYGTKAKVGFRKNAKRAMRMDIPSVVVSSGYGGI